MLFDHKIDGKYDGFRYSIETENFIKLASSNGNNIRDM